MRKDSKKRPHDPLAIAMESVRAVKKHRQTPDTPIQDMIERLFSLSNTALCLIQLDQLATMTASESIDKTQIHTHIRKVKEVSLALVTQLTHKSKLADEISRYGNCKSKNDILVNSWGRCARLELKCIGALYREKGTNAKLINPLLFELRQLRKQLVVYLIEDYGYLLKGINYHPKNPDILTPLSIVRDHLSSQKKPQQFFFLLCYFLYDVTQRGAEHLTNPHVNSRYKACLEKTATLLMEQSRELHKINLEPKELDSLKSLRNKLHQETLRLENKPSLSKEISNKLLINNSNKYHSHKRLLANYTQWIARIYRYCTEIGNSIDKNLHEKYRLVGSHNLICSLTTGREPLSRTYHVRGPMHENGIADSITELMYLVTAGYQSRSRRNIQYIDLFEIRHKLEVAKQRVLDKIEQAEVAHIDAPLVRGATFTSLSGLRKAVQCLGTTRKHLINYGDISGIIKEIDAFLLKVIYKLTAKGASFTRVIVGRSHETALNDVFRLPYIEDELIMHIIRNDHIADVLPKFREMMIEESLNVNYTYGEHQPGFYRKLFQSIIHITQRMIEEGEITIHASENTLTIDDVSNTPNVMNENIFATSTQGSSLKITQIKNSKKETRPLPNEILAIQPVSLHQTLSEDQRSVIFEEMKIYLFLARSQFMRSNSVTQGMYDSTTNERTTFLERLIILTLRKDIPNSEDAIELMLPCFKDKINANLVLHILSFISESNAYRASFNLFNSSLLSLRVLNKKWNSLLTHQQLNKYLIQLKHKSDSLSQNTCGSSAREVGLSL